VDYVAIRRDVLHKPDIHGLMTAAQASEPLTPAMHPYPRHQAATMFRQVKPRAAEQERAAERRCERW
jgi:hypothetical protein